MKFLSTKAQYMQSLILKGNYAQSEYFHKRAFQTIKESESFLELFSGSAQDLYYLQSSIKRIKSYIEI